MGSKASFVQLLATFSVVSGARALFLGEMGSNACSMQLGLFFSIDCSMLSVLVVSCVPVSSAEAPARVAQSFGGVKGLAFLLSCPLLPSSALDPASGPDPLRVNTVFLDVFGPQRFISFFLWVLCPLLGRTCAKNRPT